MQIDNWKNMPGPGDQSPPDDSIREAAREALRPQATRVIADSIYAERIKSAAWVSDAQGDFSQDEYDAITAQLCAGLTSMDLGIATALIEMRIGALVLGATHAALRRGAMKEAAARMERLEREDEADYYRAEVAS